jgi:hypothetical protein
MAQQWKECSAVQDEASTSNSSSFALATPQNFEGEYIQRVGSMTVRWFNTSFICSRDPDTSQDDGGNVEGSLADIVKSEWPYITLAGGTNSFLSVCCLPMEAL